MFFNNIIYFIIVLLIFNTSYPDPSQEHSLIYALLMHAVGWIVFGGYCRLGFRRLLLGLEEGNRGDRPKSGEYQSLTLRLSLLAIFLFALDVYVFQLKYWLQVIPGSQKLTILQGIFALGLFFFYLSTLWYFAWAAYRQIFRARVSRHAFIASNLKLNLPILFPWLILTFFYDLISISPWSGLEDFLNSASGQVLFFVVFLTMLMIFMPRFIQYGWGCKPFEMSDRVAELEAFLRGRDFRYREILRWPIFEGRMMTAGIMGIVPRYRYILITDALMEILTVEELKAVMAHEMGHAKYLHMLFYLLFILGYMVLSVGLFDSDLYFLLGTYVLGTFLEEVTSPNLFYLLVSFPILVTMIIYFRFVMGFFMRQFERQADLYSAVVMESPAPTIRSLEKIAFLSGKSRAVPSWHHFSVKERVDCLRQTIENPGLVRRHNRFVAFCFTVYLICIFGGGYLLNFSPMRQNIAFRVVGEMAQRQLKKEPDNILIYESLAMFYHNVENFEKAVDTYERLLAIKPNHAIALNNLAWILVTSPEEEFRDKERALILAKEAVALERTSIYLDTLAEAYYANGLLDEAVENIEEAISLGGENREYYEGQLRRFKESFEIRER